jgi:hypothetical protein
MPVFLKGVEELRDTIAVPSVGEYFSYEGRIFEGNRVRMKSPRLVGRLDMLFCVIKYPLETDVPLPPELRLCRFERPTILGCMAL